MKFFGVIAAALLALSLLSSEGHAWNIPGHMLSGAIAYQILQQESPRTIPAIRSVLEENPWYAGDRNWKNCRKRTETKRSLCSQRGGQIMSAPKTLPRATRRGITFDFPFKPEGEPASIQAIQPPPENILTAIAENQRIVRSGSDPAKRGIALSWLFHLVGDIHQPLHAVQLFSREYPHGDRGGIEMCVRPSLNARPIELHRLWDGVITSSGNIDRLRSIASDLLRRFSGSTFRELDHYSLKPGQKKAVRLQ